MNTYRIIFGLGAERITVYVDAPNRLAARAIAWDRARGIIPKPEFPRAVLRETWIVSRKGVA